MCHTAASAATDVSRAVVTPHTVVENASLPEALPAAKAFVGAEVAQYLSGDLGHTRVDVESCTDEEPLNRCRLPSLSSVAGRTSVRHNTFTCMYVCRRLCYQNSVSEIVRVSLYLRARPS